jgi:DNA repair photolyase
MKRGEQTAWPGRGAISNPPARLETRRLEIEDDGWGSLDEELPLLQTTVQAEAARHLITRNDSPDVPFEQSINPYRGCEHGCVYCFARPSHAYVGLSSGLDFETRLFFKADARAVLERELAAPGYRCRPIAIGTNTDPWQPIERIYRVTREILTTLEACGHPVSFVTKGALVMRDIDLLARLAERDLVHVYVSLTSLDAQLKRRLEPRAASPRARLRAVEALRRAGVPVGALVAPVIPGLTDVEIERLVSAAAGAGAQSLGWVMLRLPYELGEMFARWLQEHYPERAQRVLNLIREVRGGRINDPRFGHRMRGAGPYARLIEDRFRVATERRHLSPRLESGLSLEHFNPPARDTPQLALDL